MGGEGIDLGEAQKSLGENCLYAVKKVGVSDVGSDDDEGGSDRKERGGKEEGKGGARRRETGGVQSQSMMTTSGAAHQALNVRATTGHRDREEK